ncbi:hypothetical protein HW115_10490 [Verrucomicrobiaceae bacterium N1E253]|uniref:Rossmann fold nucleotide-binding protein n=1 Tax=Oceaniferula marina TaxID=2748318 RepID=A0A851GMJ5_9BACT|nr:hypothetical protein [Oceaniferula marina]
MREIDSIAAFRRQHGKLKGAVVQGLDLRLQDLDWSEVDCEGAVFLGCGFPDGVDLESLRKKGALIFPTIPGLPYHPHRHALYSREELMEGWTHEEDLSRDKRIYDHFHEQGRTQADVLELMAQRIHDHAIDDALGDLLEGRVENDGKKKVVGIMGGHSTPRTDPYFRKVALIARALTQRGYYIASGGGPGIMEAANLGAWMGNSSVEALDEALEILCEAPVYTDEHYVQRAQQVLEMHPHGCSSLAVPTWFYGHEPTNLFSLRIAKYFSNSIREDGLLAISHYGIIYAPGSAGTTQEIFMDATQNHYVTFDYVSPMVFLGKQRYQQDTMLFDCISQLAEGKKYADYLLCTDDENEVVEAISSYQLAGK